MTDIVEYKRVNDDEHIICLGSQALPDIHIDYSGLHVEERGGTSVRLLGASCLYCFAATLGSSLTARGVAVKSMSGVVELTKGKDDIRRTKVMEMNISIEVEIEDRDKSILEKCKKIMDRGCLLTYTLEDAIEITYRITRKG